jgi:hypothetical protein
LAYCGLFGTHREEHGNGFVNWKMLNPPVADAPGDEGGDGDGVVGTELPAQFGKKLGVKSAFGFTRIKINLQSRNFRLFGGFKQGLQSFIGLGGGKGRRIILVRIDSNDGNELDAVGQIEGLHSRDDFRGVRQQFDGRDEKSDGFAFGIKEAQILSLFPGPENELWARQTVDGAKIKVKPGSEQK